MKKICTRWIALMLALVMCVGVLPVASLAEGEEEPAEVTEPAAVSEGSEDTDEPEEPEDADEPTEPTEVNDPTASPEYPEAPAEPDAEPEVETEGEYVPSAESEDVEPQAAVEPEPAAPTDGEGDGEGDPADPTEPTEPAPIEHNVSEDDLRIERLSARVSFGAKENANGDWVWTPVNDSDGHDFAYRVTYSFGSTEIFMPGEIEFFVPKSIIRNIHGEKSDIYEMSVPHKDDEGLTAMNVYVYEEVGDQIRVFNRVPALATQKGYFEISYVTAEKTYEYMDYDAEAPSGSDEFSVTMNLKQGDVEKSQDAEAPRVYIDTAAYVTKTEKRELNTNAYTAWQSSWGEEPENANDYYYLIWEIHTYIKANQAYNFTLEDIFNVTDGEVVGYKLQGESAYTDKSTVENLKTDFSAYGRYDYVLTRHLKATYDHYLYDEPSPDEGYYSTGAYTITNVINATVTPACLVDEPTTKSASRPWTHRVHQYTPPGGHFWSSKWGLDYKGALVYSSDYIANYELSNLIEGEIDEISGLRYYLYVDGYAYPWTWEYDGEGEAPPQGSEEGREYYGKKPVHYTLTDSDLVLETMDGYASAELEPGDYEINSLDISCSMYLGRYDETNKTFTAGEVVFSDIAVSVQLNGSEAWTLAATKTSTGWTINNESIVESARGNTVSFKEGVTGFKVDTENAFYYTVVYVYPSITLKNTDTVLRIAKAAQDSGQVKVMLINHSRSEVDDSNGTEIFSKPDTGVDYILGVDKEGHVEKSLIGHKNDVIKRCYSITWQCSASESYLGYGDVREYIEQQSGTFYDLIPAGGEFTPGSVVAYADGKELSAGEFEVRTVLNYKDTGRTLVIVEISTPAKEYYFTYKTEHSWDAIHEYGNLTHNLIAYETGNDKIGHGYKADGGNLTGEDKELMSGLDDTEAERFVYTTRDHEIGVITAGSLGLYKRVKNANETDYKESTVELSNMDYSYRIRFATDEMTEARHLVVYDSLENYTGDGKSSDWRGYFTGLDLSVPRELGIEPVVYYSTTANLDIEANQSLDGEAWVKASEYTGELKDVKAVAIDLGTSSSGTEYVLPVSTPVSITVFMRAPASIESEKVNAAAYNNVYLRSSVKESTYPDWNPDTLEHQDYVTAYFRAVGSFTIKKVEADNTDTVIPGITFQLRGTSDYGTDVDLALTTNRLGEVSFRDIERGTYTLQEVGDYPDYLADHTMLTVTIAYDGSVTIEGELVRGAITKTGEESYLVTNEPRIHGDLELIKRGYIDGQAVARTLSGVVFKLEGVSDYGNTVVMFAESDSEGRVTFTNIELGEYELTETKTTNGYILSQTTYIVKCDLNGIVTINDAELQLNGKYVIYNEPLHT
ncbi:MAG: hypothetical protein IIT84_02465, partial [Oscillospiraceae bacterium]|nr:hypothetical protein [Oscillospiraceae bacterium]